MRIGVSVRRLLPPTACHSQEPQPEKRQSGRLRDVWDQRFHCRDLATVDHGGLANPEVLLVDLVARAGADIVAEGRRSGCAARAVLVVLVDKKNIVIIYVFRNIILDYY